MSRTGGRPPAVYLHIGPPKTGTTFIQGTLRAWRRELREAGILYPSNPRSLQFYAALDARGDLSHGIQVGEDDVDRNAAAGAWGRLVKMVKHFDGTSIISHEVFASADDEHAEAAVRGLADMDPHLVVTARDPARQIMSAWQQRVRQGSKKPFASVASSLRRRDRLAPAQDIAGLLDRWGGTLAPDHVHVVTVPPAGSDPTLLWERFAEVVGIDSTRCDTSRTERANEALGWAEVETLRRVNVALDGRISHPAFSHVVAQFFAREIMTGLATSSKAALPKDLGPLADRIADRWIDTIRSRGYDVVGDLEDLRPRASDAGSPRPNDAAIAEVAVKANAELLIELARREQKASRIGPAAALRRRAASARRRLLGPSRG